MSVRRLALSLGAGLLPVALWANGLDPSLLLKPPIDAWPTHHGDYSGRRYSTLKQIDTTNVKGLSLAWIYRLNTSEGGAVVGGEGPETPPAGGGVRRLVGQVHAAAGHGVLYFPTPDHVGGGPRARPRARAYFCLDTKGGIHIGKPGSDVGTGYI